MATNTDRMIYFVLCQYGAGAAWAERDPSNMSRAETIIDIRSGELPDVLQILECNSAEHICSDVTGEMLAEAQTPYRSLQMWREAAE